MENWQPRATAEGVPYWTQGDERQNFGDALTVLLLEELFVDLGARTVPVRIIGSCLDDFIVEDALPPGLGFWKAAYDADLTRLQPHLVAWGLGLREPGGLSPDCRHLVEILAVRGPLSAADLGLDPTVPRADPGLLLPFLHDLRPVPEIEGRSICMPHFNDDRSDAELLAQSGCDEVVRPVVDGTIASICHVIDRIGAARFVLSASLHGAMTALAYGKPAAFWDPGDVDLPFKWEDFAASVGITCEFARTLADAEALHRDTIAGAWSPPALSPLLAAAPFLVQPSVLVRVVRADIESGAMAWDDALAVLAAHRSAVGRVADGVRSVVGRIAADADRAVDRSIELGDYIADLLAERAASEAESAERLAAWTEANGTVERQLEVISALETERDGLQHLHAERGDQLRVVSDQLRKAQSDVVALQERIGAIEGSRAWRWSSALRRVGRAGGGSNG